MRSLRTFRFLLASGFVFSLMLLPRAGFAAGMPPQKKGKEIRILLEDKASQINLGMDGGFSIWSRGKNGEIFSKSVGAPLEFKVFGGNLVLGKRNIGVSEVTIFPKQGGAFRYQGKRYRGEVKVAVIADGKMALVNSVNLEDYLKSVVGGEISAAWPAAALEAQAIAARTYAYYHMVKNKQQLAQITSPLAQNYQGIDQEDPRTTKAVEATRGQILSFHGYIFPAFFHSTCGGVTEFPQNVWPLHFRLPEIVPCDYCKDSPYYHWKVTMSLKDIENKFKEAGSPIGSLSSIYPSKMSKNRVHVTEVTLVTSDGEKPVRVNEFRRVLGFNFLKSARFKVEQAGSKVVFTGWGWGHGVGMCQWGARGLALQKNSCRDILRYYYPGCDLKKVTS